MRKFIGVVLILAALWLARQGYLAWNSFMAKHSDLSPNQPASATSPAAPGNLPGLPPALETSLQAAEKKGAKALKNWLMFYGANVADPRRAWIELDYVVMVSREDMNEARRIFAAVKARTPRTSPVYARLERLAKAYD